MSPRCDRTLQREPGQRLFALGPVAQVQVAFRYRDAGMAEQFLEGIDVDPGLQHPGGEGMPQGMPDHPVARVRHAAVQAQRLGYTVHGPAQGGAVAHAAVPSGEQVGGIAPGMAAEHVAGLGKEVSGMDDARAAAFGQPEIGTRQDAERAPLSVHILPAQADQFPGPDARVQREQHHVAQLRRERLVLPLVGEELRYLGVRQDAQPAGVAHGDAHAAPPAAQDGGILPGVQHPLGHVRVGRLQGVIVDLTDGFEAVQHGLRAEAGVRVILAAPPLRALGFKQRFKFVHGGWRNVGRPLLPQLGEDMPVQNAGDAYPAPSVGGRPLPIEPGKLAKGDLLQALQGGLPGGLGLCTLRHLALLLQRLRTQAELGVVLQLHEQRMGHVSRPAFGSPAERLDEALSPGAVADGPEPIWLARDFACRMFPVDDPRLAGMRQPRPLGFVAHMVARWLPAVRMFMGFPILGLERINIQAQSVMVSMGFLSAPRQCSSKRLA